VQNIFPITTKRNCKVRIKLKILASCEKGKKKKQKKRKGKASHVIEAGLMKKKHEKKSESALKHSNIAGS